MLTPGVPSCPILNTIFIPLRLGNSPIIFDLRYSLFFQDLKVLHFLASLLLKNKIFLSLIGLLFCLLVISKNNQENKIGNISYILTDDSKRLVWNILLLEVVKRRRNEIDLDQNILSRYGIKRECESKE